MKVFIHARQNGVAIVNLQVCMKIAISLSSVDKTTTGAPIIFPNKVIAYSRGCGWYRAMCSAEEAQKIFNYASNKFEVLRKEQLSELRELLLRAEKSHSRHFAEKVIQIASKSGFLHEKRPLVEKHPYIKECLPNAYYAREGKPSKIKAPTEGALYALKRRLTRHV